MARRAPRDDGKTGTPGDEPERTCAVTRAKLSPEALIRFVADPDGAIVPDVAHRLPGRGVWLELDRGIVEKASRVNAFARSLKRAVTVPEGLADRVEALLLRRAIEALSIANKAGLVVTGFTKVDIAVGRGEAIALLHAMEAASDGAMKLDRKLVAVAADMASSQSAGLAPEIVTGLNSEELSLALGRHNVVHAALRAGGAARYFITEAERLRRYRATANGDAGRPPQTRPNTEQV